jgi:phosphohistidine phosphatase
MSKRLYLLRHGEAPASYNMRDQDRCLSEKGQKDALALGQFCLLRGYVPEFILCSDATRTKETLAGVLKSLEVSNVTYTHDLYTGSAGDYLHMVQQFDDRYGSALIVAHNPSIHSLAATLASDDSPESLRLQMGYAPATLTVLECPIDRWADIQPRENDAVAVMSPKDYNDA